MIKQQVLYFVLGVSYFFASIEIYSESNQSNNIGSIFYGTILEFSWSVLHQFVKPKPSFTVL
jgi:hypothetical protein